MSCVNCGGDLSWLSDFDLSNEEGNFVLSCYVCLKCGATITSKINTTEDTDIELNFNNAVCHYLKGDIIKSLVTGNMYKTKDNKNYIFKRQHWKNNNSFKIKEIKGNWVVVRV